MISGRSGVFEFAVDQRFRSHLEQYTKIVQAIENGDIASGETLATVIPPQLPPSTRTVRAAHCRDGSTLVEFLDDGGSFAGHRGFVFKNNTGSSNCVLHEAVRKKSWRLRRVTENWYRFTE
jgi:hypothetical protein